jgi:two-component system LytT family response regulator
LTLYAKAITNTSMIRLIIVDDEKHARDAISHIVSLYCPDVKVVARAADVSSGIEAIKKHRPDLVLLDIKMPDGSGFDLIRATRGYDYSVIFITAYDEYAIKAFRFNAVDYLLKPIDPEALSEAIQRIKKLAQTGTIQTRLEEMMKYLDLHHKQTTGDRVVLKTNDEYHIIDVDDIISIEADTNYCWFYLTDSKKIFVAGSMKDYEKKLPSHLFFRIHQSHIINLYQVKRFNSNEALCLMRDNSEVPVSQRKKDELIDRIKKM